MSSNSYARNWTCHATIYLEPSNYNFTIPAFGMTGNLTTNRSNRCKTEIQRRWLNNGKIWKHLGMNAADQNRYCSSRGTFRISYGLDERQKSWNFRKFLNSPPCDCKLACKPGYNLDTTSDRNNPRCGKRLCRGAVGIPNTRYGPHNNGIGIWDGWFYHHQPVSKGSCRFR